MDKAGDNWDILSNELYYFFLAAVWPACRAVLPAQVSGACELLNLNFVLWKTILIYCDTHSRHFPGQCEGDGGVRA